MMRWMTGAAVAMALSTPAAAQSVGEFAGTWMVVAESRPHNGGQIYLAGVMAVSHAGGDRYTILFKAYEPVWGGSTEGINYAEQDCTGVVTDGSSLSITCTVKPGSSSTYHPDRFTLTRADLLAWNGTMPIGDTANTMRVILSKVG